MFYSQTHMDVNNNVPEKEEESEAKRAPKIVTQEVDLFQPIEQSDSKRFTVLSMVYVLTRKHLDYFPR